MADLAQSAVVVTVRSQQGRRKLRIAQVTADGSGTTIPASHLDMNYIDHAILSLQKAALSSVADYNYLTDTFTASAGATTLTMAAAGSSGAVMDLQAWGW